MVESLINLQKIFKYDKGWNITDDFNNESILIQNLMEVIGTGDPKMIECIKKAIDSKNTQNLINSNTKLSESNIKAMNKNSNAQCFLARVWIWATIILAWVWIRATIMFAK